MLEPSSATWMALWVRGKQDRLRSPCEPFQEEAGAEWHVHSLSEIRDRTRSGPGKTLFFYHKVVFMKKKKPLFIVNVSHERIIITKIQCLDKVDLFITITNYKADAKLLKKRIYEISEYYTWKELKSVSNSTLLFIDKKRLGLRDLR